MSVQEVQIAVRAALVEDLGTGDVTTEATVPADLVASACLMAREPLVFAGSAFVECAFLELDPAARVDFVIAEGQSASRGAVIARIRGKARALLSAERVALNFAQRLSGIATLTARFVAEIRGTHARILDTRKTTPGWRRFEKHAVACGGGQNHRFGLHDLVLIKDNHLEALASLTPNPVAAAVRRARAHAPTLRVEVEADTLEQAAWAAEAGADIVLLDNMPPETLREAVRLIAGRCQCEASGGITLDTVRRVAETGVDFISVGALTHSPRSADLALDFDPLAPPLRGSSPA